MRQFCVGTPVRTAMSWPDTYLHLNTSQDSQDSWRLCISTYARPTKSQYDMIWHIPALAHLSGQTWANVTWHTTASSRLPGQHEMTQHIPALAHLPRQQRVNMTWHVPALATWQESYGSTRHMAWHTCIGTPIRTAMSQHDMTHTCSGTPVRSTWHDTYLHWHTCQDSHESTWRDIYLQWHTCPDNRGSTWHDTYLHWNTFRDSHESTQHDTYLHWHTCQDNQHFCGGDPHPIPPPPGDKPLCAWRLMTNYFNSVLLSSMLNRPGVALLLIVCHQLLQLLHSDVWACKLGFQQGWAFPQSGAAIDTADVDHSGWSESKKK